MPERKRDKFDKKKKNTRKSHVKPWKTSSGERLITRSVDRLCREDKGEGVSERGRKTR